MSDQNLPHKPSYLSSVEWQHILSRDLSHCARYNQCARTGQTSFCSAGVDLDHAQPRELGGDDTVGNVRLLCEGYNRGRPCEPWAKWSEPNFFDHHDQFATRHLREIQRLVGWDAIGDITDQIPVPGYFRRTLLDTVTLLPGATGIGKSLMMQAALFRFNKLIGLGFPRVRHVLWLTNDTTLRDMAASEIESEAYALNMVDRRPTVRIAKRGFDDLLRGPLGGDITLATVQALWLRQDSDGNPMRGDAEKLAALNHFDTIVFDECDWGDGQVRHISQLARHALQFALTASPLTFETTDDREAAENFIRRFVLISPEAVADYTRALNLDACLKLLKPATVGPKHKGFDYLNRGEVQTSDQNMPRDHALYRALILQAVVEADNLETRMKASHPDDWYSPHVMVRMDTIQELLAMKDDLGRHLANLRDEGTLLNDGWEVAAIFMGRQMSKMPWEERDLSARRGEQWLHPFLLAKNNNGRAVRGSKRILLVCQIGLRGINNWPINTIVDCTSNESVATALQFAWGRPIRLPKHLARWTDEVKATTDEREYVTVKVWLPEVDGHETKRDVVEAARNFIVNMLPMVRDAGFLTWTDLIDGKRPTDPNVVIDASNRPLTQDEKYLIQGTLARADETLGPLTPENIPAVVAPLFPDASARIRERASEYAGKLFTDQIFRDRETLNTQLEMEIKQSPENVMERLRPQDQYDPEDLRRWVRHDPRYKGMTDLYVDRIDQSDVVVIHAVSDALRKMQIANYRPAARTRRLHGVKKEPGVMLEIAGELKDHLDKARQLPENDGEVNRAVVGAAKSLFDIDDAGEGGPMDHPAYHIAMLGKHRRRLQAMARGRLISAGLLGDALKKFASAYDANENAGRE